MRKPGWYSMTAEQRAAFGREANERKKEMSRGWPKHVEFPDTTEEWDKRMEESMAPADRRF